MIKLIVFLMLVPSLCIGDWTHTFTSCDNDGGDREITIQFACASCDIGVAGTKIELLVRKKDLYTYTLGSTRPNNDYMGFSSPSGFHNALYMTAITGSSPNYTAVIQEVSHEAHYDDLFDIKYRFVPPTGDKSEWFYEESTLTPAPPPPDPSVVTVNEGACTCSPTCELVWGGSSGTEGGLAIQTYDVATDTWVYLTDKTSRTIWSASQDPPLFEVEFLGSACATSWPYTYAIMEWRWYWKIGTDTISGPFSGSEFNLAICEEN